MATYEQYMRNRQNRLRNGNQGNCNCDCNGVGDSSCFCGNSHLRVPGIKRYSEGIYYADANLVCFGTGSCTGFDSATIYTWELIPISGNPSIVGNNVKVGNDRVEVAGTGRFVLSVTVTFRCVGEGFVDYPRQTADVFTQ